MIVKIISSWSPVLIICNLKCGSLSEHTFKFADKRLGSWDNRSTNAAICSLLTGSFRRLHSVSTSSQSGSVSRYPSTLHIRPDTCAPSSLDCIIRIHQDSSSAERPKEISALFKQQQEQPMLIETLVAECRLDHSGSFVHGVASVW